MPFGLRLETVALALQTTTLLWLWWRQRQQPQPPKETDELKKVQKLESEVIKKERARVDERRGRVTAEKELRRVMEEKLDTSKGCFVQPVGTVQSCFKVCLGTPRQGSLAPSTRAKITFYRSVSPDTLVGLEEFSHVWILFVFHQNTNGKNARAHEGLRSDSHRHTFRAKVSPPMLKERVGIFCTRSPHRPNPIGITLAQLEHVDIRKRTVYLTGVDLLDETPVLDIKPYISAYDSLPDARAAGWVFTPQPSIKVEWDTDTLRSTIYKLSEKSVHYRNAPEKFVAAIEEVLQVDVRSKFQTRRWTSPDYINHEVIDNVRVQYRFALSTAPSSATNDDTSVKTAHIQIIAAEEAFMTKLSPPFDKFLLQNNIRENLFRSDPVMAASLVPVTSSTPTLEAVAMTMSTEASRAPALVSKDEELVVALEKALPTVEVAGTFLDKPLIKKRRRDYSSKPKKKKTKYTAKCVGYYVDALDKKLLWGEASIIQCNFATRKIKVHFVGWSKNHDLWTDVKSITAHGRYAPRAKDNAVKSWNGDMHLFEDVLEKMEVTAFAPVVGSVEDTQQVALLPASFTDKSSERQEVSRVDHIKRSAPKRKADVDREKKPGLKCTLVAQKVVKKTKGLGHESVRRLKQVQKEEGVGKRRAPVQCLKKQKREGQQPTALTIAKACSSTKKRAVFSNELPVFCNLELDDGTVMDFSVQREKARVKREAMQHFLDECAGIWKNQLHVHPK